MELLKQLVKNFYPFAKKRLRFNKPAELFFKPDFRNAQDPLGKTAQYDPDTSSITLFTANRHPKDILRSFSHELVHHAQNCRGEFDESLMGEMGEGYAQDNEHLRDMEREAYEEGNLCFRDWEDSVKSNQIVLKVMAESCQNAKKELIKEQGDIQMANKKSDINIIKEAIQEVLAEQGRYSQPLTVQSTSDPRQHWGVDTPGPYPKELDFPGGEERLYLEPEQQIVGDPNKNTIAAGQGWWHLAKNLGWGGKNWRTLKALVTSDPNYRGTLVAGKNYSEFTPQNIGKISGRSAGDVLADLPRGEESREGYAQGYWGLKGGERPKSILDYVDLTPPAPRTFADQVAEYRDIGWGDPPDVFIKRELEKRGITGDVPEKGSTARGMVIQRLVDLSRAESEEGVYEEAPLVFSPGSEGTLRQPGTTKVAATPAHQEYLRRHPPESDLPAELVDAFSGIGGILGGDDESYAEKIALATKGTPATSLEDLEPHPLSFVGRSRSPSISDLEGGADELRRLTQLPSEDESPYVGGRGEPARRPQRESISKDVLKTLIEKAIKEITGAGSVKDSVAAGQSTEPAPLEVGPEIDTGDIGPELTAESEEDALQEKTKTDSPDRSPPGHPEDRLKPLEEEEVVEEGFLPLKNPNPTPTPEQTSRALDYLSKIPTTTAGGDVGTTSSKKETSTTKPLEEEEVVEEDDEQGALYEETEDETLEEWKNRTMYKNMLKRFKIGK